jgi:hypothetical protein
MTGDARVDTNRFAVERIPASGRCGEVSSAGGGFPNQSAVDCNHDAEYQVFLETTPPESALIVSSCEDHIEDAAEWIDSNQAKRELTCEPCDTVVAVKHRNGTIEWENDEKQTNHEINPINEVRCYAAPE